MCNNSDKLGVSIDMTNNKHYLDNWYFYKYIVLTNLNPNVFAQCNFNFVVLSHLYFNNIRQLNYDDNNNNNSLFKILNFTLSMFGCIKCSKFSIVHVQSNKLNSNSNNFGLALQSQYLCFSNLFTHDLKMPVFLKQKMSINQLLIHKDK